MIEELVMKFSDTICFPPAMCCASLMVLGSALWIIGIPFKAVEAIIRHFRKNEPIEINVNEKKR